MVPVATIQESLRRFRDHKAEAEMAVPVATIQESLRREVSGVQIDQLTCSSRHDSGELEAARKDQDR